MPYQMNCRDPGWTARTHTPRTGKGLIGRLFGWEPDLGSGTQLDRML
jgi:hypothetical protein